MIFPCHTFVPLSRLVPIDMLNLARRCPTHWRRVHYHVGSTNPSKGDKGMSRRRFPKFSNVHASRSGNVRRGRLLRDCKALG